MKRISIGRGRECDIRIKDSSDKISRKQCVITTNFFGRMRIYDTSANGTFLNGERVPIPDGIPLKKGDSINFAHTNDFDWNSWKDPYRIWKILLVTLLSAAIIVVVLLVFFADMFNEKTAQKEVVAAPSQEVVADDTVASAKIVSPLTDEPAASTAPMPVKKNAPSAVKQKKVIHQEVKDNDESAEEPEVRPDPRLNNNGTGGNVSDDELNKRRKM